MQGVEGKDGGTGSTSLGTKEREVGRSLAKSVAKREVASGGDSVVNGIDSIMFPEYNLPVKIAPNPYACLDRLQDGDGKEFGQARSSKKKMEMKESSRVLRNRPLAQNIR
ncbi:hypothetical protein LIER_16888 [Lithospermum erythrorhizon]|uniref:Uncharacterized protein n=1 Tax=Lithospermum erythrorhizon TaxID=34254 RepID=A0AAV3QAT2_LITER